MHYLEKKIARLLARENLIAPDELVVAGVSGGPDSLALLHVLHAVGEKLLAVYVDHGLRPGETEYEAQLVRQQAEKLTVPWEIGRVDVTGLAKEKKMSIEQAARELRYDFLQKTAEKFQAGKIAVAHTADDQAEELLLRLIRGTGRSGLAGMKFIRDNYLIRPLLTTCKQTLLDYLADKNIPFAEDSSNRDRRYLRNRVRLDLLPELEKYNSNIRRTLRRTAMILTDEEDLLTRLTDQAWQEVAQTAGCGDGIEVCLDIAGLLGLHRALQRRILEMVFVRMTAPASFARIDQLLYLAEFGQGGAMLHFAGGLRCRKKGGLLLFSYPQGRKPQRGNLLNLR